MMETLNLTKQAASGVQDISQFNFDKFDDRSWSDEWRGKFFTDLWELREDLELMGLKFRQNKKVIARVAKLAKNKESGQQSQDLLEWENVLDTKDYAFQIMARTTDSYLQTVSATGAQFANLQSRSINRLTGLASLFFPASLCAAVLAIPSFSHAGEATKFWYGIISSSYAFPFWVATNTGRRIFWVFSVPVSIILALLLISPFPARLRKQFAKRREKKARENRMRRVKEADENRRRRVPSRENELADRKLAQKKMGSAPADPANMV
ncbi:hypothetical protein EJ04DRAFT_150620 [Polyplosphaeria fusca]|uniref:Uncharacterized protein n=1 Tax=Polyplosphaeria fusca TaxID=682080 RepID=A0A9P4R4W2_9PLEO|nr:hypothetical protein EJ04DRAFT_150620 [Polyplosphaeria fusca]